jgi:cysteine protease ATG4
MLGYFDEISKHSLGRPGDSLHLLGRTLPITAHNAHQQLEMLCELFAETPWLTYRSGFPELYHELKGTYVTDTGWGCMIRVGQMAFAQMLRRHRQITTPEQMAEVIALFNDMDKGQPFSIHAISRLARMEYGLMPGDWYNPSQIANTLAALHASALQASLCLSFLVFNSGNLFLDQAIEVMLAGKAPRCACDPPSSKLVCTKCNKAELSLGLVLLARIGLDSPEEKYLGVLTDMMKMSSFSGVIGGRPGKALYLVGLHTDGSYIYLDPHYVQEAQQSVEETK